jgi:hypothetical protein
VRGVTDAGGLARTGDERGPLLVLGAGLRCGSTLLQRLLSSHPDVLIWGEHAGQLQPVLAAIARMRMWADTNGRRAREEFAAGGYQSFMANLTPEPAQIDEAMRRFIQVLFVDPARELGRSVWGFKEVRYGLPEAQAFQRLFPKVRVIHVVRDPRDVLRSLDDWERNRKAWQRRDTYMTINNWLRVAGSFLHSDEASSPPVLRLRYEDIVRDPAAACGKIGEHAGIDSERFDMAVFARRIHRVGPSREARRDIREWDELPSSVRGSLESDDLRIVAAACGYDL